MKFAARSLLLMCLCGAVAAQTSPPSFPSALKNVIVIVQENRTPDNLFHFLTPACQIPNPAPPPPSSGSPSSLACSPTVTASCYDVSPCGISNQSGTPVPITLTGVPMSGSVDPNHSHTAFNEMCDPTSAGLCQMDGAWQIVTNPPNGSYAYVQNPAVTNYDGSAGHLLEPYNTFAKTYGWANFMYQTNQGPSYPAHQFLFSGTSALSASDDGIATFISENFNHTKAGCLAPSTAMNDLLTPTLTGRCPTGSTSFDGGTVQECSLSNTLTGPVGTFCVLPALSGGHESMATLLNNAGINWEYYAPSAGSIWTAPVALKAICDPQFDSGGNLFCNGTQWANHVDVNNLGTDILNDITNCNLKQVNWVIPNGTWSDHAGVTNDWGPSWVAAIINAIGNNPTCAVGTPDAGQTFWQDTAIIVTWDDWGGWSDNQPPQILSPGPPCTVTDCQGDYQYGFRVPLLVVSAYTPSGYINNSTHDFGSILRMIENLYGLPRLGFADSRATNDLVDFFSLTTPRTYTTVPALKNAAFFLSQGTTATVATDPDDD